MSTFLHFLSASGLILRFYCLFLRFEVALHLLIYVSCYSLYLEVIHLDGPGGLQIH